MHAGLTRWCMGVQEKICEKAGLEAAGFEGMLAAWARAVHRPRVHLQRFYDQWPAHRA
jgi:hypothetical protein